MRRFLSLFAAVFFAANVSGQIDTVSITDINTPKDLANCNDTSIYYNDTVVVYAYALMSGGVSEVASGSIQGANGVRPFIWFNDTANGGAVGPGTGLEVMGVNWNSSNQATAGFTSTLEGELVEMVGVVGMFGGATQFQPLNDQSYTIIGNVAPNPFTPTTLAVGDLNDANQVNQIQTGQPYEGGFVKFNNVTVTNVNRFGSGTTARVSFTIADSAGNRMDVEDFFLAQKLDTWATLNPNSPADSGSFDPPSVGSFFNSISGVIEHSSNGCAGGTGTGYILHPFDSSHYDLGKASPAITNVQVSPTIPSSSDSIAISADVVDPDGSLDSVYIFWSADTSVAVANFTKDTMAQTGANSYAFTIPPQADESIVRFYIRATDNEGLNSLHPQTPSSASEPNTEFIYVLDGGLTIPKVQQSFDGSGTSPFAGQVVTVRGFVTGTSRDSCALGYTYIQDSSANEYAGIALRASLNLASFTRGEEVEVTGTVVDGPGAPSYGFASINVLNVQSLGNQHIIDPVVINPADSVDMEKYESMLVSYENPNGKVYITDSDLGFGEYRISSSATATGTYESKRVLAGRSVPGQADGSLWVSLISDSTYITQDGTLRVPAVIADDTMTMDAMVGVVTYAFGNYKLTPRNNRDIKGLNVTLDTSCGAEYFSVDDNQIPAELSVYPNPASSSINIAGYEGEVTARIFNIKGQLLHTAESNGSPVMQINTSKLIPGIYLIQVADDQNQAYSTQKVIITQ